MTINQKHNRILIPFIVVAFLWCSNLVQSQTVIFTPEEQELNDTYALADMETIRHFIREVLDEPLSSSYEIPGYIQQSSNAEEASKRVGANYPDFYGKQGTNLLEAVKMHPAIYVRMIKEYKAIRKLFEPTN